ncbi:hypothetical protein D3C85_1047900 [compost metagenome]
MPADEHPGKARRLQPRHHDAGPTHRPRQSSQLGQLGRIIDDQGFPGDGAGEERRQRPNAADLPELGAQMRGAARAFPGDHVSLFEADEGLERQDEAVQYLLEALSLCQRCHPAQQGLRLLTVSGLPLPATHQLHQRGLQLVAQGFEFAIAYHLVSSTLSALEEDYARHHEVAMGQLTVGQSPLLAEGKWRDKGDLPQPLTEVTDDIAE